MSTNFTLPELGENIAAGDVVRVLVSPGDVVTKDQPLLELETDKATIEVPSTVSGTVKEVKVKQGEKVKVGQVVLTVDDGGGAAAGPKEKEAKPPDAKEQDAKPKAAKPEKAPAGEKPKPQPVGAAEEGGLSQEMPEARPKRGEVVDIRGAARNTPPAPPPQPEAEAGPAAPAAPSVRRLARELGVDIQRVPGSGPEGRISIDDVQAFVRSALSGGGAPAPGAPASPLPDFSKWTEVERKPMSNIRRKTAEHLSRAWVTIPHVTQHDRADITLLESLRKQYSPQAEKAGGKLTMTAIALKIVGGALQRFPQFNASVDLAKNEIVYKKSIHVGVAADTERGLLVPVIRDVDRKGVLQLAVELGQASEKARAGKLSLDEMQGGGFTITNLGGIGGTSFTPIVNWPEVAILGISRGAREPVYVEDRLEPRLMLPLSLSYDHRVIDGADAARFLRWVAEAFEQPFVMAL
ncbi:MAG TPA: 2-oxo acid dehydrogenase subunit E2 [Vicinamibacterales bacterium]|jgi:pyruvate dehydrogenase E2 component (dihydrolipoamide acetyltransferase)